MPQRRTRKPGLSRDAHTELGAELAAMSDRLCAIAARVDNAYSPSPGNLATQARARIDRMRAWLDEIVFDE
jgi:hypothetical protein